MENQIDNKFTWVIQKFSALQSGSNYSDQFVIGGFKWRLLTFPKGDGNRSFLPLYLEVSDREALPHGWMSHTKFSLKKQTCFDQKTTLSGFPEMIPYSTLHEKGGGFLVNGVVKIVAEIEVLGVIGKRDVSEEPKETTQPLKKIKREEDAKSKDLLKETLAVKESIDVNGFQVLPSQAEFVSRVFKKYPDIASQLGAKNESLRTAGMYVFLSLIKTLCKSLQELSNDDLMEADNALTYLKCSGIKLDWLEQKLEEVKVKKKQEQIGETRMQELEEELKGVKQNCTDIEALLEKKKEELNNIKHKCSDIEGLLEKEKAKVLAARAPALTLG
ncbi:unnamed protein product [Arabis nemorensis]|uniref:MATH domain-containing protein n=1 Tax=Arabis nemorensis TaxID=586526 RepID=A0A565BXK2_9BRAS|nr:unnamed protein product [Arabis nemorensis]